MPRRTLKGSIFSSTVFPSGLDTGLVSLGRACNQLVWHFSTPGSSSDKRERSLSRNRGLRIENRAKNERDFTSMRLGNSRVLLTASVCVFQIFHSTASFANELYASVAEPSLRGQLGESC